MKYYLNDESETALIVIPSINANTLSEALVRATTQTHRVETLVVFDGPISDDLTWIPSYMTLPWNVGANGFYGHRIYSMIAHISNHDYIFFLDEDNFYENNHVEECLKLIQENPEYGFVHSYRNVVDKDGKFVCRDTFEAIGEDPINLIDTSTYCFRRNFLVNYGHLWHFKWGADRRFFQIVKQNNLTKFASTKKHTVNYRLDGNPGSPTSEFFLSGNIKNGYSPEGFRNV